MFDRLVEGKARAAPGHAVVDSVWGSMEDHEQVKVGVVIVDIPKHDEDGFAQWDIFNHDKGEITGGFTGKLLGLDKDWLARAINLRSRLTRSATGDQAMFFRRAALLQAGGVPPVELFEDVRLWRQMKRAGRLTLLEAAVTTSARLWQHEGTWRVIALHWRLRALHALGVSPRALARRYPSGRS